MAYEGSLGFYGADPRMTGNNRPRKSPPRSKARDVATPQPTKEVRLPSITKPNKLLVNPGPLHPSNFKPKR